MGAPVTNVSLPGLEHRWWSSRTGNASTRQWTSFLQCQTAHDDIPSSFLVFSFLCFVIMITTPRETNWLPLPWFTTRIWPEERREVDDGRSDYMPGPRTIITMECLTTCLDPGRGWTITSGGRNFLKKQECWEGHGQALITTIRKETKRTEELEKAGYRSPTWAVLRVLQQINSGTRIEGEVAIRLPLISFIHRGKAIYSSGGKKKD